MLTDLSELEQKGLIEALGIKQEELGEAKNNLLGFFETLHKIDQRLKQNKAEQGAGEVV